MTVGDRVTVIWAQGTAVGALQTEIEVLPAREDGCLGHALVLLDTEVVLGALVFPSLPARVETVVTDSAPAPLPYCYPEAG